MLAVRLTALIEDFTCPSDCTYRRFYLSVRLHLPKILLGRQTELTEDVTCTSDSTYWRLVSPVTWIPEDSNLQELTDCIRNMDILAAINIYDFYAFGKEPSNSFKIYHIWPFEYLVSVAARLVNFKLRSCGMWRRPSGWLNGHQCFGESCHHHPRESMFLRNVGSCLFYYMTPHPRIPSS